MIGLLRSVITHAGLSPLCLCCCPEEEKNGGGSQFAGSQRRTQSARRTREPNPLLGVRRGVVVEDGTGLASTLLPDNIRAVPPNISRATRFDELSGLPTVKTARTAYVSDESVEGLVLQAGSPEVHQSVSPDEWWVLMVAADDDERR